MMGPKGEMPMMKMMRQMMEGAGDFNPMEMCKMMMSSVAKASEMSFYATPEIRTMFEEWLESVEEEIFDFVRKEGEINLKAIAGKFQISESAARFFLNHLAASGKIKADFKGVAEEERDVKSGAEESPDSDE